MRLAIAGKGGTGKTTIAGTLARLRARAGRAVVAIDADSSPNLGAMLGLSQSQMAALTPLSTDLLARTTDPDGTVRNVLTAEPEDVIRRFASTAPDGVELLVMGRVNHSGAG